MSIQNRVSAQNLWFITHVIGIFFTITQTFVHYWKISFMVEYLPWRMLIWQNIMVNKFVKTYSKLWPNGLEMSFKYSFFILALVANFSAERYQMWNFGRVHFEEDFNENVLNWASDSEEVVERFPFLFLILVQRSRTICTMLLEGIKKNIWYINLNLGPWFRCCLFFLSCLSL